MKILLTGILLALLLASSVVAQKAESATNLKFDTADFVKKSETAEWLVEYDHVAWKSTDTLLAMDQTVLAKLGQEWFCFQDKDKQWHAVYGKLTEAGYEAVLHFVADKDGKITRSDAKIDQTFLDGHARALATGRAKLVATIPKDSPRFNQYIRQNGDGSFSVWMFPAFQQNGVAVYGGEAIYTVDSTGKKILKDESYFQPNFRGFQAKPPRDIWITYPEHEKPSLGAVFFVWYYKSYFTSIMLENKDFNTTALKTPEGYMWVHIEKKKEAEKKPD